MRSQERKLLPIVLIFFVLFFIPGGIAISKDKPGPSDKESIKATLIDYENTWNKKDVDGVISFYHQDAKIMTGAQRKIVSREQYADIIPDRLDRVGSMKFSNPKIKISGDEAKVKVTTKFSRGLREVKFIFYMVRQNDRWLIIKTKY